MTLFSSGGLMAADDNLLLRIRESTTVTWSGRHRPALTGQGVYPRPVQDPLPIWVGVGGTPQSFVRAGLLGLPLMVAIIGGEPRRFAPLIDLYRRAGAEAGFTPDQLPVGLHVFGFVGDSTQAIVRQTWRGEEAGYVVDSPGKPVSISGSAALKAGAAGSVLTYDLEVTAGVPLVGGKLEKLVCDLTGAGFDKEHAIGVSWLARG